MRHFILILGLIAIPLSAQAKTIHVPQDYPDIQAAVDASVDGDEIVVSPGVYSQPISISKLITLRSAFDGTNWDAVNNTVLKSSVTALPVVGLGAFGELPTVRGFRITRDPVSLPPAFPISEIGVEGNGIIEYNIIENQVDVTSTGGGPGHTGGAIIGCNGIIQNNIIRNNRADDASALSACGGIIRNNVIYGNIADSAVIHSCSGKLINNTLYNNTRGLRNCSGQIANNIIWTTYTTFQITFSSVPENCIIKDYTGPGTGNIDADPKFVDAARGDFRLQADSPAIDAGKTTTDVRADINGVQRGLKGTPPLRGDGSAIDIGAYEFLPRPIAIWFPGGPPDAIHPGGMLSVAWQIDANAGPEMNLALHQDLIPRQAFGAFQSDAGETTATLDGRTTVALSLALPYSGGYTIRASSAVLPALVGQTPFFTILGTPSAVRREKWNRYP